MTDPFPPQSPPFGGPQLTPEQIAILRQILSGGGIRGAISPQMPPAMQAIPAEPLAGYNSQISRGLFADSQYGQGMADSRQQMAQGIGDNLQQFARNDQSLDERAAMNQPGLNANNLQNNYNNYQDRDAQVVQNAQNQQQQLSQIHGDLGNQIVNPQGGYMDKYNNSPTGGISKDEIVRMVINKFLKGAV